MGIGTSTGLCWQQRHARFWLLEFILAKKTPPLVLIYSQVQCILHWKWREIAAHIIHDTLGYIHNTLSVNESYHV